MATHSLFSRTSETLTATTTSHIITTTITTQLRSNNIMIRVSPVPLLALVLAWAISHSRCQAFSMSKPLLDRHQQQQHDQPRTCTATSPVISWPCTRLWGILDDLDDLDPGCSNNDDNIDKNDPTSSNYETTLEQLIFSTSPVQKSIVTHWQACSKAGFRDFVARQVEASNDPEEKQALNELLQQIVKEEEKQKRLEAEQHQQQLQQEQQVTNTLEQEQEDTTSAITKTTMSAAEVIQKANAIDQGFAAAALSDDEKPADFMRDCREVVNLSGGFNDRGQLRVGG